MNTKTATAISKMRDVSRPVQPRRTAAKAIYSNLPELVKKMFLTVYETTKIDIGKRFASNRVCAPMGDAFRLSD
jgi:hypothetical protein